MKQKRNKGFTLIELLAVIVILAIIALIAVPVIMNIINKANKSAFKDTAYGVISAGELYFAESQLEPTGMSEDVTIELPDSTNTLGLKGNVPEGSITITTDGKISLTLKNDRYCVTKGLDDEDITITEDFETCELPETRLALGKDIYFNPVENRICDANTEYTETNSVTGFKDGCMRWYVYKIDGNNLGLILDHNTTASTEWLTLNAVLKADTTDQGWKVNASVITIEDIMNMLPWYQNLTDKSNWSEEYYTYLEEPIYTIMSTLQANASAYANTLEMYKAMTEMLMTDYSEIALPRYLHEDLYAYCDTDGDCTIYGYWISDAVAGQDGYAWVVYDRGILSGNVVDNDGGYGLRPVITLPKSAIQ